MDGLYPSRTGMPATFHGLVLSVGETLFILQIMAQRQGCGQTGMNSKNEGVGAAAPQSSAPTGLLSGLRFCKTVCWLRKAGWGGVGGISGGAPRSTQMPTFGGDTGDPGAFAGKRVQLPHPHQKCVVQVWESRVMGALFLAQARTS